MNDFHFYDMHVHTFFSDGQHNFRVILEGLIDLGIKIVGFSDHLFPGSIYFHNNDPQWKVVNMFSARRLRYRKKYLQILNRKYSEIEILHGAEIDCLPNGNLTLPNGITPDFFDYLAVVKHHTIPKPIFPLKKFPKWKKWLWKNDPYLRGMNFMWRLGIQDTFQKYHPDIFCHPNANMPKLMPENQIRWFMATLKKFNVAFELNHFHDKISVKQARLILKYGKKYGVKFSLGSDFHGFTQDPIKIKNQLNHSQKMYELAKKFNLSLFDPRTLTI